MVAFEYQFMGGGPFDNILSLLTPNPNRTKPYFRIDGREISGDGGEVIYKEWRRPAPLPNLVVQKGNHMHGNRVEWDKRKDGKWGWRIIAVDPGLGENIIATDGSQGYENEGDCLAGLFRVFFGSYDPTFLAAHARWAEFEGAKGETVEEPYVRTDESDRAVMRGATGETSTPEPTAEVPQPLIDDGHGRMVVDTRNTRP